MLNLYDSTASPSATVVRLLTGKRTFGANTHVANRRTQSQLLYLVEQSDCLEASDVQDGFSERQLRVA